LGLLKDYKPISEVVGKHRYTFVSVRNVTVTSLSTGPGFLFDLVSKPQTKRTKVANIKEEGRKETAQT